MKLLLIIAGVAMCAAAPASSAPTKLEMTAQVCASLVDAEKLTTLSNDWTAFSRFWKEVSAADRCADLPPGTEVYLDQSIGMHRCVRPVGWTDCAWGLFAPRVSEQLKRSKW